MIDEARGQIGLLHTWGPVAAWSAFGALLCLSLLAPIALYAARHGRRRAEVHWSVWNREAHTIRLALVALTLAGPAAWSASVDGRGGELVPGGAWTMALVPGFAALVAVALAAIPSLRAVGPKTKPERLPARLAWLALSVVPLALPLLVALAVGPRWTPRACGALAAGIALQLALSAGTLAALRALGLARPAPEAVVATVRRAAARMGVETPPVYVLRLAVANAFAFPGARTIAFTEGACEVLEGRELEAIAAHELGHLSEPAWMRRLRLVPRALFVGLAAVRPTHGSFGFVGAALVGAAIVAGFVVYGRVSRRFERRADAAAVAHGGAVADYARALERIHEVNALPVVLGRAAGSHPDLWDRLLAAGVTPAYPRPAPPRRATALVLLLAVALPLAAFAGERAVEAASRSVRDPVARWERYGPVLGTRARDLEALAFSRVRADPDGAVVFAATAAELHPRARSYRANLALVLATTGRCEEALALRSGTDAAPEDAPSSWDSIEELCLEPEAMAR